MVDEMAGVAKRQPHPVLAAALACVLGLGGGCATPRPQMQAALSGYTPAGRPGDPAPPAYTLGCPDQIELSAAGRPDLGGTYAVAPDGTVPLAGPGRVRVEGLTAG